MALVGGVDEMSHCGGGLEVSYAQAALNVDTDSFLLPADQLLFLYHVCLYATRHIPVMIMN